jgi:lysozyme
MKKGIDISHYQKITDWNKVKADFIIQKCTEGTTYKDPTYEKNRDEITKKCVFGAYHFARGGDVIKEAEWFLKGLGGTSREGDILVLDWEIEHPNPTGWCKDFLDIIKLKTGLTPYLYTNEARANKIENSYPWWIARYGTNDGTIQKEPTKPWTIFQYTSRGKVEGIEGYVDLNIMKETMSEFKHGKFIKLSQRDNRWGFKPIGNTAYLIKDWGCTITCISMASSWFNCFREPDWLAKNLRFTNDAKIYWQSINEKTCFDFEWRFYNCDHKKIREALSNDRKICLLNVYNKHWVVATSNLWTGYWTADPWTGGSKYYSNSAISGGAVLVI